MSSEAKSILLWIVICGFLGLAFGVFFNTEGIKIVASIWLIIGCIAGWTIGDNCNFPGQPIAGWFMFGIVLGITVALINYNSWLTPLLR